jgi:DNA ligase (NAD+)
MDFDKMMAEGDDARKNELKSLITIHRGLYYNGKTPNGETVKPVPDEVYDAWIDELSELETRAPEVTAVGAPPSPVSEWKKVAHEIPMGSLDKVNTPEELTSWVLGWAPKLDAELLFVTEKLDGASLHVRYQKGAFVQGITLGDGTIGEDISQNVCRMRGVLGRLPEKFTGSLRGEIILTKEAMARHFPDMTSTRNAAAGIARRYNGEGCGHLQVIFYQVVDGKEFATESEQFEWLTKMGLKTPPWYVTAMAPGVKTPQDLWVEYQQTKRSELEYEIDGLVVRIQNLVKQLSLGVAEGGRPKGAVAFKFAPITRETVLKRIEWQVGGTGRVTPVAVFDPVRLLGAEVTNASVYNLKYIKELGMTPGARILIARANDVIPRVVQVTVPSPLPLEVPNLCPSCDQCLSMEGEYLVCTNATTCPAQTVGRIKRYVKELEILEWGETLIEKLVEAKLVKTPADLYRLKLIDISSIDRMGEKSAENVLKTLWAKNPIPLDKLLGSLSIPLCGTTTITAVMDAGWDTWPKIMAAGEDLQKVPNVGPVKGANLYIWVKNIGVTLVKDLIGVGVKIKERTKGVLTGTSFCFTGKSVRKRSELEGLVTENGGTVKASVTKGLTYLVLADPTSASTKAQAAKKNGTKCISEEDFVKMVSP